MNTWKTDPNLLSVKIHARIESGGEISYSELEKIATVKDIDLNVFDAAITRLHRSKKVKQRTKGEEIYYKAVPKPKRKTIPAKQCLVEITKKKSPFYGAMVYPLDEFKCEGKVLYRYGAVATPGYGENRIWFSPTDIGLAKDDLPLPAHTQHVEQMPFPEIDMSWIVLRPSEMLEYKAQMKGMPLYMMKQLKKHENYGNKG